MLIQLRTEIIYIHILCVYKYSIKNFTNISHGTKSSLKVVCMHIYIYIYIYIIYSNYTKASVHTHTRAHPPANTPNYPPKHPPTHPHTHTYIHSHTYTYTYTHTHIHTHTYTKQLERLYNLQFYKHSDYWLSLIMPFIIWLYICIDVFEIHSQNISHIDLCHSPLQVAARRAVSTARSATNWARAMSAPPTGCVRASGRWRWSGVLVTTTAWVNNIKDVCRKTSSADSRIVIRSRRWCYFRHSQQTVPADAI